MVIGHWLKIRLVHLETGNKKLEHTDLSTNGNEYFLTIKTSFPTSEKIFLLMERLIFTVTKTTIYALLRNSLLYFEFGD